MKYKLSLILLLSFVYINTTHAQKKQKKKKHDMVHNAALDLENQANVERDSMVFFHSQWEVGTIVLKDGKVINDVPLLYDLERDQVELLKIENIEFYGGEGMLDTTFQIFEQHQIAEFRFDAHVKAEKEGEEDKVVPHHFINAAEVFVRDESPATGIYEIIVPGKVGFITYPYLLKTAHRSSAFMEQERLQREVNRTRSNLPNNTYHNRDVYYSFKLKETKYLLLDNKQIIDLPAKKKDFLNLFGGYREMVHEFMKETGFQYRDKQDLIKILKFYNEKEGEVLGSDSRI